MDQSEPVPFATATILRTRDYYEDCYRAIRGIYLGNKIQLPLIVLYAALGAWLVKYHPLGWIVLLIGIFLLGRFHWVHWRWLGDRLADVPDDNRWQFEFYDDHFVSFHATATSRIEWEAIYRANRLKNGLLLWPGRGLTIFLPYDRIDPPQAAEAILEKCAAKSRQ